MKICRSLELNQTNRAKYTCFYYINVWRHISAIFFSKKFLNLPVECTLNALLDSERFNFFETLSSAHWGAKKNSTFFYKTDNYAVQSQYLTTNIGKFISGYFLDFPDLIFSQKKIMCRLVQSQALGHFDNFVSVW